MFPYFVFFLVFVFTCFFFQNIYPNGLITFETCFAVLKTENLFPKQQPNRLRAFGFKRLSAYGFYYVGGTVKEYLFYLSLILIFYIIYLYCRKDSQESLIILLLFIFTLVLFRVQIL